MTTLKNRVGLRSNKNTKSAMAAKNVYRYISLDRTVSKEGNGSYTSPLRKNTVRYDIRKLDAYCKSHGIKPESLTKEELKKFVLA